MKNITFKRQIYIGIALFTITSILVSIIKKTIFINIAWIIYGLLFIFNPVYPKANMSEEKGRKAAKIAGWVCFAIGLFSKFNL